MKIENFRLEKKGDSARVVAKVSWEDINRPAQEVYFETEQEFASDLSCNPDAFLVGCIIPAMHHGESRVYVSAEICPELRNGLMTAMEWLRHWYYDKDSKPIIIEAKNKSGLTTHPILKRTGSFFSGGIDSLATLRANSLLYPKGHPALIRDGLILYGQNIESDNRLETFKQAVVDLSVVTRDAGISLIPIYTNIRSLDTDPNFFLYQFHGAILASVAHVFTRRLTHVSIASTDSIPNLTRRNQQSFKPLGSHPLLDICYSSNEVQILHDGIILSRLMKTKLIADWNVALQNIKVCGDNWPGMNCGKCKKCVLTMLNLLVVGKLGETLAFPVNDISAEMVKAVKLSKLRVRDGGFDYDIEEDSFLELINPLIEKGHHDLVEAIQYMIKKYRKQETLPLKSLKRLKRFIKKNFKHNYVKQA